MDEQMYGTLMQQSMPVGPVFESRIDSHAVNGHQIPTQHMVQPDPARLGNNASQQAPPIPHQLTSGKRKPKQQGMCQAEVLINEEQQQSIKNSPAYYLGLFLDSEVTSWLIAETSLNGVHMKNFAAVSVDEMRCFVAVLYLSGYVDVPRRRMLWERAPDAHCPLVSSAMQRDRFEAIFTALHMGDGLKDDAARLARLSPLIHKLNQRFLLHAPKEDQHSIAECTIPASRHNTRAPLKSLRVWCGCTKSGYCVWFDPCQTQTDRYNNLFVGRSIIANYANLLQRYKPSQYSLLFESAYSEMALLCELQRLGIQGSAVDRDKSGCLLNPALGGLEKMDCNISLYRISMRGKKCYSNLVTYALDVTLHNAWQLYKLCTTDKKQLDLLGFRRNLVIYYLQHHARPLPGRCARRAPRVSRGAHSEARYDGLRHWVVAQVKQTRCARCAAKTTTRCLKCDVGVHVKCFVDFHQRPREANND